MKAVLKAVLLIPEPDWREALLGDGPCGARVPTVYRGHLCGHAYHREWHDPTERPEAEAAECYMCRNALERALPLAWSGVFVREGRDRAAYVLAEAISEGAVPNEGAIWGGGVCGAGEHRRGYGHLIDFAGRVIFDGLALSHGDWDADLVHEPALRDPPEMTEPVADAWTLATVCAARGLGRVEVL